MKHTNFWKEISAIRERANQELKDAIKAHGGSYIWLDVDDFEEEQELDDDDICDCPVVTCNTYFYGACEACIHSIEIDEHSALKIWGHVIGDRDPLDEVEFFPEDIVMDQIENIIDAIPKTDKVYDVSEQKRFPVVDLCREDLIGVGYDVSETDDDTMRKCAGLIAKYYLDCDFWGDLRAAACECKIPKIENDGE